MSSTKTFKINKNFNNLCMQQKDSEISPSSLLQKKMLKDESEPT